MSLSKRKFEIKGVIAICRHPTFHLKKLGYNKCFGEKERACLLVTITELREFIDYKEKVDFQLSKIFYHPN